MLSFIDLTELVFITFFSFTSLFALRKFARRVGLVDLPNSRKFHDGAIPLVGGISLTITLLYFLSKNTDIFPSVGLYAFSIICLVIVGAIDDKFDISFRVRFFVQGFLAVLAMVLSDFQLHTVGNLFGFGDIELGWFGYAVTILAVVGAINAFNMVDGIDGLLGGLSIVTFGALAILMCFYGNSGIAYFCLAFIASVIPYILLNLGVFGKARKVFMGDAGSMMIGFTVVWLMLESSQNQGQLMRPVTALWLIAVPLMDMAAIMYRRVKRGDSPFKPDREHLHHIFQRLGLGPTQTLIMICFFASIFAGFGILGEVNEYPEYLMFYSFLACFFVYSVLLSNIWKITKYVRKKRLCHIRKQRSKRRPQSEYTPHTQ